MDITKKIAQEIGCRDSQVDAAIKLIDEGNTIPFIARYRKEATGSLNDEQLRLLHERLVYLRNLEDRKSQVLSSIDEQGKLTPELKASIEGAETMVLVEDLYRPYKPKRKTRATIAKDKGLEGLANTIVLQMSSTPVGQEASQYISEENGVLTADDAIAGAMDIIAENISDTAEYRTKIRELTMRKGVIQTSAKDMDTESVYEMYYDFSAPISKMTGYRTLAINRGEKEKILSVKVDAPVDEILSYLHKNIIKNDSKDTSHILSEAIADSYDRLIAPAIEREVRNSLTEAAEDGAIKVFASNLHQLLMQPPISGQTILGWDPAFRTGCKLAVVDPTGKVLDTVVIFPTAPQKKVAEAKKTVKTLIKKYGITLISVGNGTASRESEMVISELIAELDTPIQYIITNEAAAANRAEDGVDILECIDDLERRRALAEEHLQVVERVDVDITVLLLELEAVRIGVVKAVAVQHDFRAERARALDLEDRRRRRHADDGLDAELPRCVRYALRVVAGRGRDDAAHALLRSELADLVVGTAELEGTRMLKVLRLEIDIVVAELGEIVTVDEPRLPSYSLELLGCAVDVGNRRALHDLGIRTFRRFLLFRHSCVLLLKT